MMKWADYGFPDRLRMTPWKTIITGLVKALQYKIFCTGTAVYPLARRTLNDLKVFDYQESQYSIPYFDFKNTRFYAYFDYNLEKMWQRHLYKQPTYKNEDGSINYSDQPQPEYLSDVVSRLGITTYITDYDVNLSNYYNKHKLAVNKYSRQWALDRYKIINEMNISNCLNNYRMGVDSPFNNLPNNSLEYEDYPNTTGNSAVDTYDIGCMVEQPRIGQYKVDYFWRDKALGSQNQMIFKAKPTIKLYYSTGNLRSVEGTFFENYQNYDSYVYKKIQVAEYSQVNNIYYVSNGQPFWKPDEIVANKQKYYDNNLLIGLYNNLFNIVDITGRDFYDDPAVYKDISYDDFWKHK